MDSTWTDALSVGGVKVKPTSRSKVVPATPTEEHWIELSNLDRVVNPVFSSAILIYRNLIPRSNRTFDQIMQSLKESLATTLVDFYPLAGRLALRDDGLVDLHCNDEGAVLVGASLDADLAEVDEARPMPGLSGLALARLGPGPLYIPDQLNTLPVLVIQVTQFTRCGTVAIVVNWHHTVADGSSGCHFLASWSEVAMGKDISLRPDHKREQLRPRNPPDSSLVKGYSTQNVQELLPTGEVDMGQAKSVTLKCFSLTNDAVQELKRQARTEECQYTSVEAISGHLWRVMSRARQENPTDDDNRHEHRGVTEARKTRYFLFVDGRKKLGLSQGYFGNLICSACAVGNEDDIAKLPISYSAELIREATRSVSAEYFRSLIDWVEEQGQSLTKSEHVNSLGHDCAATFWTSFPLYELDFGWGTPTFAARNSGPRQHIDGIAMMPSPEGPGHFVAMLNSQSDRMARIENDAEFLAAYCDSSSVLSVSARAPSATTRTALQSISNFRRCCVTMLIIACDFLTWVVNFNSPGWNLAGKPILYRYFCDNGGRLLGELQVGVLHGIASLQYLFMAWRFCIKSGVALGILTWKVMELMTFVCVIWTKNSVCIDTIMSWN